MLSRSRGYLPHLESPQSTFFLTFRLDDSLPSSLLSMWKNELHYKVNQQKGNSENLTFLEREYYSKVESYLDKNYGQCWLRDPSIARMVIDALRFFDGKRYFLHAWTIMPNHMHVLCTLFESEKLSSVVHSWKSFTAKKANLVLGRTGRFWQPEYFDRTIKSKRQFEFCLRYILNNPVKAGLCEETYQWIWSGCSEDLKVLVDRLDLYKKNGEEATEP